ncbi:unnamed protein product [Polarella glacialis]|uniref:Protein kinase domain-containing protein n=1 Tax=Polarella glacialis TaxID=89957 RepID=A0A813HII0_POLGL|nr:unnamed protein product [Polarella glacialis]
MSKRPHPRQLPSVTLRCGQTTFPCFRSEGRIEGSCLLSSFETTKHLESQSSVDLLASSVRHESARQTLHLQRSVDSDDLGGFAAQAPRSRTGLSSPLPCSCPAMVKAMSGKAIQAKGHPSKPRTPGRKACVPSPHTGCKSTATAKACTVLRLAVKEGSVPKARKPFAIFIASEGAIAMKGLSREECRDAMKRLAVRWRTLLPDEKARYTKAAVAEADAQRVAAWELGLHLRTHVRVDPGEESESKRVAQPGPETPVLGQPTPSATTLAPQAAIDSRVHLVQGYDFLEVLGQGSFGKVCKCLSTSTGRLVAIKMFTGRGGMDYHIEKKIYSRLDALPANNRSYFPLLLASLFGEPFPYLVLELRSAGRLSSDAVRSAGAQLQEALRVLRNSASIVHLDVKPGNIMWAPWPGQANAGTLRLTDFGLAAAYPVELADQLFESYVTELYRPPELYNNTAQNLHQLLCPSVDIFSYGCVLFEFASGRTLMAPLGERQTIRQTIQCWSSEWGDLAVTSRRISRMSVRLAAAGSFKAAIIHACCPKAAERPPSAAAQPPSAAASSVAATARALAAALEAEEQRERLFLPPPGTVTKIATVEAQEAENAKADNGVKHNKIPEDSAFAKFFKRVGTDVATAAAVLDAAKEHPIQKVAEVVPQHMAAESPQRLVTSTKEPEMQLPTWPAFAPVATPSPAASTPTTSAAASPVQKPQIAPEVPTPAPKAVDNKTPEADAFAKFLKRVAPTPEELAQKQKVQEEQDKAAAAAPAPVVPPKAPPKAPPLKANGSLQAPPPQEAKVVEEKQVVQPGFFGLPPPGTVTKHTEEATSVEKEVSGTQECTQQTPTPVPAPKASAPSAFARFFKRIGGPEAAEVEETPEATEAVISPQLAPQATPPTIKASQVVADEPEKKETWPVRREQPKPEDEAKAKASPKGPTPSPPPAPTVRKTSADEAPTRSVKDAKDSKDTKDAKDSKDSKDSKDKKSEDEVEDADDDENAERVQEVSPLDHRFVGLVIGKAGETIKNFKKTSGATIEIDQNLPNGMPRVVIYRGTKKQVTIAKKLVDALVMRAKEDEKAKAGAPVGMGIMGRGPAGEKEPERGPARPEDMARGTESLPPWRRGKPGEEEPKVMPGPMMPERPRLTAPAALPRRDAPWVKQKDAVEAAPTGSLTGSLSGSNALGMRPAWMNPKTKERGTSEDDMGMTIERSVWSEHKYIRGLFIQARQKILRSKAYEVPGEMMTMTTGPRPKYKEERKGKDKDGEEDDDGEAPKEKRKKSKEPKEESESKPQASPPAEENGHISPPQEEEAAAATKPKLSVEVPSAAKVSEPNGVVTFENLPGDTKDMMKLKKKLREIHKIEDSMTAGEAVEPNQVEKVTKKESYLEELQLLESILRSSAPTGGE